MFKICRKLNNLTKAIVTEQNVLRTKLSSLCSSFDKSIEQGEFLLKVFSSIKQKFNFLQRQKRKQKD